MNLRWRVVWEFVGSIAALALLFGCATDITAKDLTVAERVHSGSPFGSVTVVAKGIKQGRFYPLPDETFRDAIASSVEQAGLFTAVASQVAHEYALEVDVIDLPDPEGGTTMTVTALFGWTLHHGDDPAPLLEEIIETKCSKTYHDSMLGPTRGTMAIVGAVQANIREGVAKLEHVLAARR